ncbi:MAG: YraN family protein [Tannerella sp.]|jgi:putative endonuclease|nr:YraN family protein [Tannerella sp.]
MEERSIVGKEGEAAARAYLLKAGYNILHTNWHLGHYELDIVATREGELVVVEVKTRTEGYLLSPEEAVGRDKIKRLVAAADVYARRFGIDMPVRFDIITLVKTPEGYETVHLEDAFYAPIHRRW